MKKFFLISIVAVFVSYALPAQTLLPGFDDALAEFHIKMVCHATVEKVKPGKKISEVPKYKEENWYEISYGDNIWTPYIPVKGEKMYKYDGVYYYSVTEKALVRPKKTPVEQKMAEDRVPKPRGKGLGFGIKVRTNAGDIIIDNGSRYQPGNTSRRVSSRDCYDCNNR